MNRLTSVFTLVLPLIIIASLSSCYYDNEEELYPQPDEPQACDTTGVTYAGFVEPLMQQHCTGCHSGSFPSGNIGLVTYQEVKAQADNGLLVCTMDHRSGCSAMPDAQPKLPQCDVDKVIAWVNEGAPQN